MSPLDDINIIEKQICDWADLQHEPVGGTFELLPLCNMNCKMCYVRMSPEELKLQGRLMTLEEWIAIGQSAVDAGLLVLLLTGGEPLLYPNFLELYRRLHDMGLVISINTNGTLIDEDFARELGKCPPRRVNITLYGTSDETYGRLCGNPHGFTQVKRAVELMKKYEIPFKMNCSLTPYNAPEYDEIIRLANEWDVKMDVAPYMFPPARKNDKAAVDSARLTPEEAAAYYVRDCIRVEGEEGYKTRLQLCKNYCQKQLSEPQEHDTDIPCRAGSSTWWVNWQGKMTICGMFEEPFVQVPGRDFKECWKELREQSISMRIAKQCADCPKKPYCISCAASALAETRMVDGVPEYQCHMTDEVIRLTDQYLTSDSSETTE